MVRFHDPLFSQVSADGVTSFGNPYLAMSLLAASRGCDGQLARILSTAFCVTRRMFGLIVGCETAAAADGSRGGGRLLSTACGIVVTSRSAVRAAGRENCKLVV